MFTITDNNVIKLTRGDYASFNIKLLDINGDEYSLQDGEYVTFTVKRNTRDPNILIQKTGTTIEIFGEDTNNLPYGRYCYDAELTFANGEKDTFITPTDFYIEDEVTWNG